MLYKVVTCEVGTDELDDAASRLLSRFAKQGFIVTQSSMVNVDGKVMTQYLCQRVPISHLESQPNDAKGLKQVRLGDNVYNWDPCGDDDPGSDH